MDETARVSAVGMVMSDGSNSIALVIFLLIKWGGDAAMATAARLRQRQDYDSGKIATAARAVMVASGSLSLSWDETVGGLLQGQQ